jgi:hypothetical protein
MYFILIDLLDRGRKLFEQFGNGLPPLPSHPPESVGNYRFPNPSQFESIMPTNNSISSFEKIKLFGDV